MAISSQWSASGLFFLFRNPDNLISLYKCSIIDRKSIPQLCYSHHLPVAVIDNESLQGKIASYYPGYEIYNLRYFVNLIIYLFIFCYIL